MAFKEYDFELTETTEFDIDAIYEYIAETLENPDAASDDVFELLALNQGIGYFRHCSIY